MLGLIWKESEIYIILSFQTISFYDLRGMYLSAVFIMSSSSSSSSSRNSRSSRSNKSISSINSSSNNSNGNNSCSTTCSDSKSKAVETEVAAPVVPLTVTAAVIGVVEIVGTAVEAAVIAVVVQQR